MRGLWQDLSYGVRTLRRAPAFSATALLALTLGIGANTALFSVVNGVLLEPLPFPRADRLVQIWRTELPRLIYGSASYPRYIDWRDRNRSFERFGAFAPKGLTLVGREAPERVTGAEATASFFDVLNVPPLAGRWFTPEEDRPGAPNVIVLGYRLWQTRFGGARDVLGTIVTIDGAPHTVIGIAPERLNEVWRIDAWVPLARAVDQRERGRGFLLAVGRLAEGMTIERARADLERVAIEIRREHPTDLYGFNVRPLHDVITEGPRRALWVLLGATGLVLLIACANVTNLLLARSVTRQREIAIRTSLGAGRSRLLRQLLTEAVILGLLGSAGGLLLAAALVRGFVLAAPANFPRLAGIELDMRVLAFSMLVAIAASITAALAPALHLLRWQPNEALRAGGTRGATVGSTRTVSRALVAAEVALAVTLVAAAGLTIKSLERIYQQDLGLTTIGVLTFQVTAPRAAAGGEERAIQFVERFEERLRAIPGVTAVGAINMLPIAAVGMNGPVQLPDRVMREEEKPLAEFRTVTPDYFTAVGMRMVAGRGPDGRDRVTTAPVVVINETLAGQLWPGQPAATVVGRRIGLGWDIGITREVVGVVRDVRSRRPDEKPLAEVYVPYAQFPLPTVTFAVRTTGSPETFVSAVRRELASIDPQLPLAAVRTFTDVIEIATRNSRLFSLLTTLFGLLAATLAIVGIYSVMSYSVAQRVRELAIRAALGATRQGLLILVVREGLTMSGVGIAAGLACAAAASGVLRSLLYQVSPTDPVVYAGTAVGVASIGILGYLVPALRAARVAPASALRAE
jgi:putative ABC transport system permease protein